MQTSSCPRNRENARFPTCMQVVLTLRHPIGLGSILHDIARTYWYLIHGLASELSPLRQVTDRRRPPHCPTLQIAMHGIIWRWSAPGAPLFTSRIETSGPSQCSDSITRKRAEKYHRGMFTAHPRVSVTRGCLLLPKCFRENQKLDPKFKVSGQGTYGG